MLWTNPQGVLCNSKKGVLEGPHDSVGPLLRAEWVVGLHGVQHLGILSVLGVMSPPYEDLWDGYFAVWKDLSDCPHGLGLFQSQVGLMIYLDDHVLVLDSNDEGASSTAVLLNNRRWGWKLWLRRLARLKEGGT